MKIFNDNNSYIDQLIIQKTEEKINIPSLNNNYGN